MLQSQKTCKRGKSTPTYLLTQDLPALARVHRERRALGIGRHPIKANLVNGKVLRDPGSPDQLLVPQGRCTASNSHASGSNPFKMPIDPIWLYRKTLTTAARPPTSSFCSLACSTSDKPAWASFAAATCVREMGTFKRSERSLPRFERATDHNEDSKQSPAVVHRPFALGIPHLRLKRVQNVQPLRLDAPRLSSKACTLFEDASSSRDPGVTTAFQGSR